MLRIIGIVILLCLIPAGYVLFDAFSPGAGVLGVFIVAGLALLACKAWFEDGHYVWPCMLVAGLAFFAVLVGS